MRSDCRVNISWLAGIWGLLLADCASEQATGKHVIKQFGLIYE